MPAGSIERDRRLPRESHRLVVPSGRAEGQARDLPRWEKDSFAGGPRCTLCAWTFLVTSAEMSRLPTHTPARHDNGHRLVEGNMPAGSIERDRRFPRESHRLVVPSGRAEGHARDLPRCEKDPFAGGPRRTLCAWTFLVASAEMSRLPTHTPARHDNDHRLIERNMPDGSIEPDRRFPRESHCPCRPEREGGRAGEGPSPDARRIALLEGRPTRFVPQHSLTVRASSPDSGARPPDPASSSRP